MKTFTSRARIILLLAGAAALPGCLKARETDHLIYDPQKDEFRAVMLLEHIEGGTSDMKYLDTLRKNKDHLIAPCMPGGLFGYAPWFLRLSDDKAAKVTFVEPRAGDMQPIDAKAALNSIEIKPGAFFVQDNTLCYYHAVTVPGKTVDLLIEQSRKELLDSLTKSVKGEVDRRKKQGKVYTWDELTKQEADAVKSGSTDHPIKPMMVLETESLEKLVAATADVKKGIVRKGKDFTILLPMTKKDRDGVCVLWDIWMKAADAAAKEKKDDLMVAMQRLPAQSMAVSPVDDGAVLSIDVQKLYNALADATLAYHDKQYPFTAPKEPAFEVQFAQKQAWPMEPDLAGAKILEDFAAGTLKAHPSEVAVPPGTGLKAQPK